MNNLPKEMYIFKDTKPEDEQDIIALVRGAEDGEPYYMTGTFSKGEFWVDGQVVKNAILWDSI
jgi:hypothetical protein